MELKTWEDTVMTLEQIYNAKAYAYNKATGSEDSRELDGDIGIAKAQAEISFKAGYDQGWSDNKPYLPDANEPWDREQIVFDDGKKAGIKEVVEWINEYTDFAAPHPFGRLDWQARLKEWGL